LGGIVLKIGWDRKFIFAKVFKVYRGAPDGWYMLNVMNGRVTGPLGRAALDTYLSRWHIGLMPPGDLYAGWWYGPAHNVKGHSTR